MSFYLTAFIQDLTPKINSLLVNVASGFYEALKEINFWLILFCGFIGIWALNRFKYGKNYLFNSSMSSWDNVSLKSNTKNTFCNKMDLRKLFLLFSCFGLFFEVISKLLSKFSSFLEVSTTFAFLIWPQIIIKRLIIKINFLVNVWAKMLKIKKSIFLKSLRRRALFIKT